MAEELGDQYQWKTNFRAEKYPWDQWLNGKVWKLVQGEDYDVSSTSIRAAIYAAGTRLRKKVKIETHENFVIVQALRDLTEGDRKPTVNNTVTKLKPVPGGKRRAKK